MSNLKQLAAGRDRRDRWRRRLRTIVATTALATLTSVTAVYAADLGGSMKDDPEPFEPRASLPSTWTGLYLGASLGGAFTDVGATLGGVDLGTSESDSFIGGGYAGYNFQAGPWVLGIEGDISAGEDIDYLATIRGRLGVSFGQTLVYLTAGGAWTGLDVNITGPAFTQTTSEDFSGYVVGGGLEYKFSQSLSLRGEVLYHDFDSQTVASPGGNVDVDPDFTVVRAGITWHFPVGR